MDATALHIPWTNEALEKLVLDIINTGETTKLDFKGGWDISSREQKAELARDIQAMANSYDPAYRNHGFLILGAKAGQLLYAKFAEDSDKMQATVDQVLREHLGPFVSTQVRQFGSGDKMWGVIVVRPSNGAPHVFVRDAGKYNRGDVWVRVGTTSSKAEPADFGRFFRTHLEDYGREWRDEVRDVQREVERLKAELERLKIPEPKVSPAEPVSAPQVTTKDQETPVPAPAPVSVLESVKRGFKKNADPVSAGLIEEATAVRKFLESRDIPWDVNNITKESGRAVVDKIEEKVGMFWKVLSTVVDNDDQGKYDSDIVEALSLLAFEPEVPASTTFTDFGTRIRYFPLVMSLYVVFLVGLQNKRHSLLKRVMGLTLLPKQYAEDSLPIGTALFYVRGASEIFQALRDDYPERRWCDSVGTYAQRWINLHLYPEMPKLERNKHMFYVAEFVLSVMPAAAENIERPASGQFYFMSESASIIRRYLKTEGQTLKELFGENLKTALNRFDQWGQKIAVSGNCWGDGFQAGATELVFPPTTVVDTK